MFIPYAQLTPQTPTEIKRVWEEYHLKDRTRFDVCHELFLIRCIF